MHDNVDKANFNGLYPPFFIVSNRVLYSRIKGKQLQFEWRDMDEAAMLEWLCKLAEVRIVKFANTSTSPNSNRQNPSPPRQNPHAPRMCT